ncbi:MAG: arylsulfatase [Bacteroidales bacterium]
MVRTDRPNIVLVLTDDQGWGDLSIHGNTNLHTPNIDGLAQGGARFDRFYVCPVCSPTRAELLTGRYHPRGGVYSTSAGGERLDLDEKTLAEHFRDAGYATAAYGKWHNGMQSPYHPNARGFEDFYGFCSGHWGDYFSPPLEHNGALVTGHGFLTDDFTDHALAFLEENRDRPFLLYLPFNTPHSPMQVPSADWDRFRDKELILRNRDPEREDPDHTRAALAMCENIDRNVGRVLKQLDSLGLAENTIVLYLSDNGPNGVRWNGGMRGRKGSTDEGGVRSPLFIRWEGHIPAGTRIAPIAGAIDLLPTLAALAGIPLRGGKPLDGHNLAPLLLGTDSSRDNRLLFSHWGKATSVRSQRFRLDAAGQLYDMENDPGQRTDVSDLYPDLRDSLLRAREMWEREVLAELPEIDERTFPLGDPGVEWTWMPARDGTGTGDIRRSNQYPNCSFFTGWTRTEDEIFWEVEVPAPGEFEVTLYCTCAAENTGCELELSFGGNALTFVVEEAHDPPLRGMENDRVPRIESYVKDFRPLKVGTLRLEAGRDTLRLRALQIPGKEAIDFQMFQFKRVAG